MGGNSSYNKGWGGVPVAQRTHIDSNYRIDGHKVVYFSQNVEQRKNIINSNSANAIYLLATKEEGILKIHSINVFDGHHLSYEINLEFDDNGNLIPFGKGKGSHAHEWKLDPTDGKLKRKSHDKRNTLPIDSKYDSLISKIVLFNKQKKR